MPKYVFIALLHCLAFSATQAQQYQVPFREGNKYGLMTESGKILIPAKYSFLEWVKDKYFEASTEVILKDTVETEPNHWLIRNDKTRNSSLIYNGKEILTE